MLTAMPSNNQGKRAMSKIEIRQIFYDQSTLSQIQSQLYPA